MIYKYQYEKGVKIKIWEDEIPKQECKVIKNISKRLDGNGTCLGRNKLMAVELHLPRHISNYAMLGLIYENSAVQTAIEIGIHDYEEAEYAENMALKPDYVHNGIPEEYASGIEESVNRLNNAKLLKNGIYKFCVGAHGEVGSSIRSFMVTCSILLQLLLLEDKSEKRVKEIIDREVTEEVLRQSQGQFL